MIVHKKKNKLTAIIFALTLGCIIFLLTSANLQIETIATATLETDADIVIENKHSSNKLYATQIDPVLQQYSSQISDFGYLSKNEKENGVEMED